MAKKIEEIKNFGKSIISKIKNIDFCKKQLEEEKRSIPVSDNIEIVIIKIKYRQQ